MLADDFRVRGLTLTARQRNSASILWRTAIVCLAWLGAARPARADGAFPNAQSVLLPRDAPGQIVLGTTFGLVFTEDDGATWRYSCENDQTRSGRRYVMGPAPGNHIYGISDLGIPVTKDGACTWTIAGGDVTPASPIDVFPDPTDGNRAFALAVTSDDGLVAAYRSSDGGGTFSGPIFKSPLSGTVTGIESAASDGQTIYVTFHQRPGVHPRLATTHDGGATWTVTDIEPGLGQVIPFLAAVDRSDPKKIYLRVTSAGGVAAIFEGLAVTTDGGATWTTPLVLPGGSFDGLATLPNGNLVAIGTTARATPTGTPPPATFRSEDGGRTFTTEPLTFHPAGLGERNGTLYVATNDFLDGFALASSDDAGKTWRPRLRFRDIAGVKECVREFCQLDCDYLAGVKLFPPETCSPPVKGSGGCVVGSAAPPREGAGTLIGSLLLLLGVWVARASERRR